MTADQRADDEIGATLRLSQCQERIYVRDMLRYSGRGRGGFSMHYNRRQCSRLAGQDGYCWQHTKPLAARQAADDDAAGEG